MRYRRLALVVTAIGACLFTTQGCVEESRIAAHGLHVEPRGDHVEQLSNARLGFNLEAGVRDPALWDRLTGTVGLDVITVDSAGEDAQAETAIDKLWRVYGAVFYGRQRDGDPLFRPYVGAGFAFSTYDLDVPEEEEKQEESAIGFDGLLGVDVGHGVLFFDMGAKYTKLFGVAGALSAGGGELDPDYLQFYVGAGLRFDTGQ